MKTRSTLSLLVILGIAAILLMPGNFAQSSHSAASPFDDFLVGHDAGETISGQAGNDQIFGLSGADILNGDEGDDFMHGGPNADVMDGGDDDDYMYGASGADKMVGGDGDDQMYGGTGGDKIRGGEGDDEIFGGGNSDTIFGGPGNDQAMGGLGSDNIFLGPGNDVAFGGPNNDNIFAGLGVDMLHGGDGNDHLIGSLVGQAFLDGGEFDDDGDGFFNEDPVDFDLTGVPINNDGDREEEDSSPTFINEDGPGNDNDVCFWDGGPTVVVDDPDGIPNTGDEEFGDDVLVLDDFGDPTCETVHVLGHDPIVLGGKKGGGGGSSGNPGITSAAFVEIAPIFPDTVAGTLTLSFNTDVSLGGTQVETLQHIFIGTLAIPLLPLTGSPLPFVEPNKDPSVTFTLGEAQVILILGLFDDPGSILTITVDENVFVNKFNNPNLESFIGLSVDAIDISGPIVIGSSYVTTSGLLTVAFDEPVDLLSVDQSKIHVREAPGVAPDGVTLGGASVVAVGNTLEFIVLGAQRIAINALAEPIELDVDADAVADLDSNSNPGTNDTPITVFTDIALPFILSATYDSTEGFPGERLLTIAFNENIDVSAIDLSKASITETGGGSPISLAGAAVTNLIDGNPISIRLTGGAGSQDEAVDALLTPPQLVVVSGAFPDLSGNPSVVQTVPITLSPTDLFPPEIQPPATFDDTFGILKITFNEQVDLTPDSQVQLDKVFVSGFGGHNDVDLAGASHITSSDDLMFEIQLTGPQLDAIDLLPLPLHLDVSADAFQDPKGNLIVAVADIPIDPITADIIDPEIATVSSDGSLLTITFTEEIDPGSVDLSKIFVSNNKKRNQFSLAGLGFAPAVGDTVIIVDISTHPDILQINALGSPELDVGKNAFEDTSGNRNDRQTNIPFT